MHFRLEMVVEELKELPEYYQERAAVRIWAIFHEVETDMVMTEFYAKKRYGASATEARQGGNGVPHARARPEGRRQKKTAAKRATAEV